MTEQREEPDVIECEAVPLDGQRESRPPRRITPWIIVLALLFPAVVLLVVFRLAAVAVTAVVALARHPLGLALIAAGAVWAWYTWRDRRARRGA